MNQLLGLHRLYILYVTIFLQRKKSVILLKKKKSKTFKAPTVKSWLRFPLCAVPPEKVLNTAATWWSKREALKLRSERT